MRTWQIVLLVVGAGTLGTCALCVGVAGKAANDVAQKSAPPSATDPPPIPVSAGQLFESYHSNEVAADDRFKDKPLLVSGVVDSIDKDAFGDMIVRFKTENPFMGVMATVDPSEKAKVAAFSKGQPATLLCKGAGMVVGSPSVHACLIR